MPTRTLFVLILVLLVVLGVVASVATPRPSPQPVACTLEAKICPDGSAVGRTGPNCEFAACPSATSAPVVGAGEHCGGFIQNAPVCASGYHCQLVISRPDTGGTCVADSSSGILPYHSGIRGVVSLGPTCPVERTPPDPQCADRPYQTSINISRASTPSQVFAQSQSAADGTFEVSLPPGDYVVNAGGGAVLPRCSPTSATVSSSAYTDIIVSCDTGIR